ncbi:MAG: D-tyrosyl-tRNA(Tyr) deacylase [Acidobacteria bacterium]|nr:D-tyrosyl-tRNA(Tyr) deacylase [Acidobacteriota bacterium]
MRAVVQRVSSASVDVDGVTVGAIDRGLLVLVGVAATDGPADVDYMAGKLGDLRIFEDDTGRMNLSLQQADGALLLVSQFTVCGDCRKGRRPSFDAAAAPEQAQALYEALARRLSEAGVRVALGRFGERMAVTLVNDGPVTLLVDSARVF